MTSLTVIGCLITTFSFNGIVFSQSSTSTPETLSQPSALRQKEQRDDSGSFPFFSVKEPDVMSMQKAIEDNIKQMKKQMESDFEKDLEGFPIMTGFGKRPPVIPYMHSDEHEEIAQPQQKQIVKEKQGDVEEPGVEIPEDENPTIRILKSLNAALDSGPVPERRIDITDAPLDMNKVFHQIEHLFRSPGMIGSMAPEDEGVVFITQVEDIETDPSDLGDLAIVGIGDPRGPSEFIPIQRFDINIPMNDDIDEVQVSPAGMNSRIKGFLDEFVDAMKSMMDVLQKTELNGDKNRSSDRKPTRIIDPIVNIKIEDHGSTYNIPPNAFIDRNNPELVNITWPSEKKNFNNSLCLKVIKDGAGHVSFQHVRLNVLGDDGVHDYKLEQPVELKSFNGSSTMIKLTEGVGVNFANPESLDVVIVEEREKFSTHWLAFSVALLGLLVGGLVMLLSYIIHSKNKMYSRKNSLSKEPIA